MIKKIIGFIPTWVCYYIGHWASLVMDKFHVGYRFYNTFMIWSIEIQDWSGLERPWKNVEVKNDTNTKP